MKGGGKQSSQLQENLDYIENRTEIENSNSILIGTHMPNFIMQRPKRHYCYCTRCISPSELQNRDSSVRIVTRLTSIRLRHNGSIPDRFFFSPQRRDRLWGQPSLISNEYVGKAEEA
jgi:hypothetical protein